MRQSALAGATGRVLGVVKEFDLCDGGVEAFHEFADDGLVFDGFHDFGGDALGGAPRDIGQPGIWGRNNGLVGVFDF